MAIVIDSNQATQTQSQSQSLAPGFRFHPTDEELVIYYLRRKICGKPFRYDAISDVEVYKVEPWDLPDLSRLKTRDLEWYFFSVLDKKYGNGSRTNRATDRGYWKTTGKDRSVYHRSQLVGMKKTLVYHIGRAPKGERTNWVMHEYRLIDQELEKKGIQDAFVLCRIFRKSGSGPKNGEQYGAPFVEEEWDVDEPILATKQESAMQFPVDYEDDACLDEDDIEQIFGSDVPPKDGPLLLDYHQGDNVNSADVSSETIDDPQSVLVDQPQANNEDGPKLFDLPVQNELDPTSVKHEYIAEISNDVDYDVDYLLDEPYFDASIGDLQFDGNSFFESDDLQTEVKTEPGVEMFNDYTSFLNPEMENLDYAFDSFVNENILAESPLVFEDAKEETHQLGDISEQFFEDQNNDFVSSKLDGSGLAAGDPEGHNNNGASTSNQEHLDSAETSHAEGNHEMSEAGQQLYEEPSNDLVSSSKQQEADMPTDIAYPFLQRASYMLGNMSASSAYASECSAKYLAAAAAQASTSVRVTTGIIRIRDISFAGSKLDWSFNKNGHLDIVFSFGLEQSDVNSANSHDTVGLSSRKANSSVSRNWLYCLFLCIMVLSLSSKIRSLVCPRSYMS
ncbi:NAC domain containing protein 53 [Artemisia annua]|uniref:NAC domain containing protein 53 n=1 Tax=Artemisia annua TaxID=35608 RepID=A0A2U1NSP7_ARTAN|nr:NAC domain containing protein 53 [Artemisia annua]